jgi:hypothetical protein
MMYPSCSPWAGWYRPWAPLSVPFHLGWSRPTEGLGYSGYYTGDSHYGHVGQQQDNRVLRQKNWMVWNSKPDGPVSQGAAAAPGHHHEKEALKNGPSTDQPKSSQGRMGPRSKSSADGKAMPDMEKSLEEVVAEQNRVSEVKAETKTKTGTSSRRPPNRIVRFPKLDHPISIGLG